MLPRGIRLTHAELDEFGAVPLVGARFTTDRLDLRSALFEVIEVTDESAVVTRVAYLESGTGSRSP